MHTTVSRNNPSFPRHLFAPVLALLLAVAAACTDEALLSPEGIRPLGTAAPLVSVTPDTAFVGDTGVVMTVRGTGFTPGSTLWVDPWLPLVATAIDDSTITARADMPLWQAGTHEVRVYNEEYEASDPLPFVVANSAPVITRISPDGCEVDATGCGPITLHGRNFLDGVQILWDGGSVSFNRLSDSVVTVQVDPYQLQWQQVVSITAVNPGPGGGASTAATFQVGPRIFMHTYGATAGSGGFELEIYGESMGSDVVVYWNGSPRPGYRIHAGRVSAFLTAADVATPGENVVTVTTSALGSQPWRVGTLTVRPQPSATVTSQIKLDLPVRDLIYSPHTDRLYGTVYDGYMAGRVAVIHPEYGYLESIIWVGDSPRYLALSDDGKYLWVGVDGEFSVKRVNLEWGAYPDFTIQLDSGVVAEDLAAVPGVPYKVAVSRRDTAASPGHLGVAIYNAYDGTALPVATAAGAGSNVIEFGRKGGTLYGVDNETAANQWRIMQVDDNGVTVTRTGFGWAGVGSDIVFANGRLYSSAGTTLDTGHNDFAGIFHTLQGTVRPDPRTGRAFFLGEGVIRVGDINTFSQLGTLSTSVPDFEPAPQRRHLVRWGADGLAFHDADEVFILRSPMVGQ